jgi:PAS domain S-box-containing protein
MTANATRVEAMASFSTLALGDAVELAGVLNSILQTAKGAVAADAYALWSLNSDQQTWSITAGLGLSSGFMALSMPVTPPDMPAEVWCAEDVQTSSLLRERAQLYLRENIHSVMGAPIFIHQERRAVLAFYFRMPHRFTRTEIDLATALANLTGSALAATELYRAQLAARTRSDFLAEASALLASSTNCEETLARVADLLVPRIADGCAVDLIEGNVVKRVAVAHPDPEQARRLWEVARRSPAVLSPDRVLGQIIASRRPVFFRTIDDQMLRDNARSEEHLQVLRDLHMRSLLLMPLVYQDQVLGILTLGTTQAGRTLDEGDVATVAALANRAAVAIENARLFADLRNSRTQLRLIIDSMPALVAYVDRDQRFRRVNRTFEEWFRAPLKTFLGKTIREVIGEQNYPNLEPRIRDVLAGAEVQFEVTNHYADALRHVLVSYVPDFDENRETRGFVALIMDITQRRHAEDALRRSEKLAAAGRLAASIAHEINNPLESVTNLLYLLHQEPQISPGGREYLSLAEQELLRVSQIATQTLRFHRQSTKPALTRVEDVLDSVHALYNSRLTRLGATVAKRYDAASFPILAFDGELRQLFANLVANALDALPPQGRLLIRTRAVNRAGGTRGIRITIADNGQGIPTELLNRIFEPFVTSKSTTGTGLGLWVSKEIVHKHRGCMRVRSRTTAPSGTVFWVFLTDAAAAS